MKILTIILAALMDLIPAGEATLKPLQQRDSILVADQVEYGFSLEKQEGLAGIGLSDFAPISSDTLVLVRNWQLDTLKNGVVEGSVVLAPFEEGTYYLPDILLSRFYADGSTDTLIFAGRALDVKTMPVDTATFKIHPLKKQITYPVTVAEVLPYVGGGLGIIALVVLAVMFLPLLFVKKRPKAESRKDPAHIVALRDLEHYNDGKFWVPEKQKAFYSGITDVLKTYMDDSFGIDAPEMTTAELFAELSGKPGVTPEIYKELNDLFVRADFVKFAKYVASDEENKKAVPLCVRFVTTTYNAKLEEKQDVL